MSPPGALTRRFRAWIEETHPAGFELRRHFFLRFFDSELVSTPGQFQVVAIGSLAVVISLGLIMTQAYFAKYRALLELDTPEIYHRAALADHLFFICLSMVLSGLIATLQWPSLFPGLRDYLALAGLPVRPRQIFLAKLSALVVFVGIFTVAVNLLPSMLLPAVMAGRYQASGGARLVSLFTSTTLAGMFVFFCLIAFQGLLLNVVPARRFPGVSLVAQGVLFVTLLGLLPVVFSIPRLQGLMHQRPDSLWWLPPFWFLGLDQTLLGNPDPVAWPLALRALAASGLSVLLALAAYAWSYRRHRVRVLETQTRPAAGAGWLARATGSAADRMMPDSGERAIFSFVTATLRRSRPHRMMLTVFCAIAGALVLHGFLSLALSGGFQGWSVRTFALRQAAISAPLALSLFGLAGYRYLFRLPVELRANWIFRVNEAGAARHSFAVDRFLLWWGVLPANLITMPVIVSVFGWTAGTAAVVLCILAALVLLELLLLQMQHIPFTSAYLPGQRPVVETVMRYAVGAMIYVSVLGAITVRCLEEPPFILVEFGLLLALWARLRKARLEDGHAGRIEFEELPEPAVRTLAIERD